MKKKAIAGNMWWTLGMVILAAIVILATWSFISGKFLPAIFGEIGTQGEQGSKANLVALGDKVQKFIDSGNNSDTEYNFPYFISSNLVLVGFDKIWNDQKLVKEGSWARTESITKPVECLTKSCLCLYKNTWGTDFGSDPTENPPIQCVLFSEDITFLGPANEDTNFGALKSVSYKGPFDKYEYLIMYSSGKKLFYIRKDMIGSKNYVVIAPNNLAPSNI